jgi:hypothetical protein
LICFISKYYIGEKHPEVLNLILSELCPADSSDYVVRVSKTFAAMLLHKKLSEIDLDILCDVKDIDNMWPIMIRKCPNLKSVVCERLTGKLIPARQLTHFKKLQKIVMPYFVCDDPAMKMIANSFPKLK